MITVRPMRWWDLDWVVPLEQETFAADPPWTAAVFWSELAGVPSTRWYGVAENGDGRPVGYAGLRATGHPGEPADLLTIAVNPGARRSGAGSALLAVLLEEATTRHAGEMLLEVRQDNAAAIAFYRHHGFARLTVRRRYYADGADAVVMRRPLPLPAAGSPGGRR